MVGNSGTACLTNHRKSWAANLMEGSDLTFDPCCLLKRANILLLLAQSAGSHGP